MTASAGRGAGSVVVTLVFLYMGLFDAGNLQPSVSVPGLGLESQGEGWPGVGGLLFAVVGLVLAAVALRLWYRLFRGRLRYPDAGSR